MWRMKRHSKETDYRILIQPAANVRTFCIFTVFKTMRPPLRLNKVFMKTY